MRADQILVPAAAVLSLSAAMVAGAIAVTALPRIEGRFFPVARLTITHMEPVTPTRTRIWGALVKHRDCAVTGLSWWQGEPWESAIASYISESGVIDREVGGSNFGPFAVDIPMSRLPESSATTTHNCHPVWETQTIILQPFETIPRVSVP